MFDLTGNVALIVGGTGYLGEPICKGLAAQGATVVIADIAYDRANATAKEIAAAHPEVKAQAMKLDIGCEESVKKVIGEIDAQFGSLDVLVNCAYWGSGKKLEDLNADEFDKSMHVNLTGSFILVRKAAEIMPSGSSIILFSSMYGQVAPDPRIYIGLRDPNPIEYGVAKAGTIQMVKYFSIYLAPRNIRVNAVAPGTFPNDTLRQKCPEFIQRLSSKVPLERVGCREEIMGAVVFLASGEASYITGETIAVNGGWTAW